MQLSIFVSFPGNLCGCMCAKVSKTIIHNKCETYDTMLPDLRKSLCFPTASLTSIFPFSSPFLPSSYSFILCSYVHDLFKLMDEWDCTIFFLVKNAFLNFIVLSSCDCHEHCGMKHAFNSGQRELHTHHQYLESKFQPQSRWDTAIWSFSIIFLSLFICLNVLQTIKLNIFLFIFQLHYKTNFILMF